MPALADHLVRPGVPPPTAQGAAAAPPPPSCGLLTIQEAILRDAAVDVAGIKLQMARTIRLLRTQRPVLLDQLAEVVLSAHHAEGPTIARSSVRLRASRPAGRP